MALRMTLNVHRGEKPDWREAAAAELTATRAELLRNRQKAQKAMERMQRRLDEIETELSDLDRGARALGLPMAAPVVRPVAGAARSDGPFFQQPVARRGDSPAPLQFKDVALDYLADVHPASRKATDVQAHVEEVLGRTFHWKTAGMTLYRLKNEHKVRRAGQQWSFVPISEREALAAEDMLRQDRVRQMTLDDLERDAEFDAVTSAVEDAGPGDEAKQQADIMKEFFE